MLKALDRYFGLYYYSNIYPLLRELKVGNVHKSLKMYSPWKAYDIKESGTTLAL